MSAPDVFRRITSALDQAGIPYMLTGSFASAYHGAPRATQDIDIVIAPNQQQLGVLKRLLPEDEYYVDLEAALDAYQRTSLFNIVDMATGWKVDFIIRKARAFSQEEFSRRTQVDVQGIRLFIASAEDVVISKLEWAKMGESQRQIEDVAGILRLRWDQLDRSYVERWVSELQLSEEWQRARRLAGVGA
jgi:hypothetical protein